MIHTQLIFICDNCDNMDSFLLDNDMMEDEAYDDAIEWAYNRGWNLNALSDDTVVTNCAECA